VPGGPVAEGDYPTLTAALVALNAADGGTILLREGTYHVTAETVLVKPIRVWAVEENVVINNQLNADDKWVFNFSAFSTRGSELRGLRIVSDALLSSEHAVRVNDCRFSGVLIEGCVIQGELTITGDSQVQVTQSTVAEAATNAYSPQLVLISGSPTLCFQTCQFDLLGVRTEGILLTSITALTSAKRAHVAFNACSASLLGGNQHFIRTSATGTFLDLHLGVDILLIDGSQNPSGTVALSGGANYLKGMSITVAPGGNDTTDPVLRVSGSTAKTDRCVIDGLYINGNGTRHTMPTANRTLVLFNIRSLSCRDMHVTDWELPDSSISGSSVNRFMLVTTAPQDTGAHQYLERCLFTRITNTGVNDMFHGCLGNSPAVVVNADATVEVASCIFDVSGHAYNSLASRNTVLLLSNFKNAIARNNKIIAGHWYSLLQFEDAAGGIEHNIIDADSALGGSGIGYLYSIRAFGGPGPGTALNVVGNKCLGLAASQQSAVPQLSITGAGHDAVSLAGNTVRGAIPGADIAVVCVDATLYGNITDGGYTVLASGTQRPAVLLDHNV